MTPDVTIGLSIIAFPFVLWAALVLLVQFRDANLRPTLRLFLPIRWALALVAAPFVIGGIVRNHRPYWLLPIGMSIVCCSFCFTIVEGWVRRKFTS